MNDLWEALGRHAEAFKGVYWPSNFKELADVFFLVVEAGLQCSLDIRDHLNTRLAVHEPVFLVGATAFFFISLWWIRGLLTYDASHPGLLRSLLTTPHLPPVSSPCHLPCATCAIMTTSTRVPSAASSTVVQVDGRFTCGSSNVVYVVTCDLCGVQYVGETGSTVRTRFVGHRGRLRVAEGSLGEHFGLEGHSWKRDLRLVVVQGGFWTAGGRKKAERELIREMNSMEPNGLNRNAGMVPKVKLGVLWSRWQNGGGGQQKRKTTVQDPTLKRLFGF